MVFARSTTLRASSFARIARPTRYIRTAELQPWQRMLQRRTYASSHGAHGEASLKSDLPWLVSAVAGTAGGLYLVLNQDLSHGEGHDEQHHEKGEEVPVEGSHDEEAEDKEEPESKEESKEDSKEDSKADAKDESKSEPAGDADTKVEEANKKQKEESEAPADPAKSDQPTPRKEPGNANQTSGKQQGLSNDETHHTQPAGEMPEKSKKGEGVADTAKLKGTVSTERPGAENKEERGKAEQDKSK